MGKVVAGALGAAGGGTKFCGKPAAGGTSAADTAVVGCSAGGAVGKLAGACGASAARGGPPPKRLLALAYRESATPDELNPEASDPSVAACG